MHKLQQHHRHIPECKHDKKQTQEWDQTQATNQQGVRSLQKNRSTPKKRKLDQQTTYGNESQLFCEVHVKKSTTF